MNNTETIKNKNRIETVAARYGTLHRTGNNYTMLCPFHDDHHPSLFIHTGKQFFTCYACGKKGDVFTLVQGVEGIGFREALVKLGGDTEREDGREKRQQDSTRPTQLPTYRPQAENLSFLESLLPYHPGHTELTDTYLAFGVGTAPHITQKRFRAFAGRVIFPVHDGDGHLTGFGGKGENPRYINSSIASGYNKGETLYGLHRAQHAISERGEVWVTEGYRDVLAMHAAGYEQAVGLSGTAMADGQFRLLCGMDAKVIFLMDGDEAGQTASCKHAARMEAEGISTAIISLPSGDDPDSLFRSLGKDGFRRWIEAARFPAGVAEELLVTLLLMYPVERFYTQGQSYFFAPLLLSLLETDRLPFTGEAHWKLLCTCTEMIEEESGEEIPPPFHEHIADNELRVKAMELYDRHSAYIMERNSRMELPFTDFAFLFIYEYYEEQILKEIEKLTGKLRLATGIQEKEALLSGLDEWQDFLQFVSKKLNRTGVIAN